MTESLRPWKLCTFAIGVALMVTGASYRLAPDWDIPISLIMPALTYLTASWSIRVLTGRRWKLWPLALFAIWFTADGVYWLYWHRVNPAALEAMRGSNWPASLPLYFFCGMLWLYRGSLRDFASEWRELTATRTALRAGILLHKSPSAGPNRPPGSPGIGGAGAAECEVSEAAARSGTRSPGSSSSSQRARLNSRAGGTERFPGRHRRR